MISFCDDLIQWNKAKWNEVRKVFDKLAYKVIEFEASCPDQTYG